MPEAIKNIRGVTHSTKRVLFVGSYLLCWLLSKIKRWIKIAITLREAIKIADKEKYAPVLAQITEYSDRYVFSYVEQNGEAPDISPLHVMKETCETGLFFPPDYDDEYYNSGINIPIPKDILN